MSYEREIGKIRRTFLGWEDHGILTATVDFDFGGHGQGLPGYSLDTPIEGYAREGTKWGMEFIRRLLLACGVNQWEELPGRTVYVLRDSPRGLIRGVEPLPTEPGERFVFSELEDFAEAAA